MTFDLTETDWAAITAVLYGTPSPEQRARVNALRAIPSAAQVIAEASVDASAGGPATSRRTAAELAAAAEAIVREHAARPTAAGRGVARPGMRIVDTRKARVRSSRWEWATVAVLSAAACIAVLATGTRWHHAGQSGSPKVVATPNGSRAMITLADGSHVTLGPASVLRYDAGRWERERRIEVEGEAYFDVASDADRPFIVQVGASSVRVLGTTFVVRAYPHELVHVAVASGKVALRGASTAGTGTESERTLVAGDVGLVDANGVASIDRDENVATYLGQAHGVFSFANVPLNTVRQELSRWYGARIEVADPALDEIPVTMTIDNEALSVAIDRLAAVIGARATHQASGDVVIRRGSDPLPAR